MWHSISCWLSTHDWVAVWLEGIALVATFVSHSLDSSATHKQTIAQLTIAHTCPDALINSERAWAIAEFVPLAIKCAEQWCRHVGNNYATLSTEEVLAGHHLRHSLKLNNMGRTPAHILAFEI